jgi:hypothetical protein
MMGSGRSQDALGAGERIGLGRLDPGSQAE